MNVVLYIVHQLISCSIYIKIYVLPQQEGMKLWTKNCSYCLFGNCDSSWLGLGCRKRISV